MIISYNLTEDTDFLRNDFVKDDCTPMELQWKLFRGVLSKSSKPLNVYNKFMGIYEQFWDVVENTNNLNIDIVISNINDFVNQLSNNLDEVDMKEIKICAKKLCEFLDKLKYAD